ncbi:hypothetical protein ABIC17_001815 [Sphingomonas sp. PvP056]
MRSYLDTEDSKWRRQQRDRDNKPVWPLKRDLGARPVREGDVLATLHWPDGSGEVRHHGSEVTRIEDHWFGRTLKSALNFARRRFVQATPISFHNLTGRSVANQPEHLLQSVERNLEGQGLTPAPRLHRNSIDRRGVLKPHESFGHD